MRSAPLSLLAFALAASAVLAQPTPPYPASQTIGGIEFDLDSVVNLAPGSDNWVITWAEDDHQYTAWGDGGGFGGTNDDGRVLLGIGRVEGPSDNYQGFNVWGGFQPENEAEFEGKAYGILALGQTLYMWRSGNGSGASSFAFQELYVSNDSAASWTSTGVRYEPSDFPSSDGFFTPTFLQFGRGYAGARDGFVYCYAPENKDGNWNVQKPGEISLLRVPAAEIANAASWELFAGVDGGGDPLWTSVLADRQPVVADAANGVMRTSVSYNPGLGRYLLTTQQVDRFEADDGHIGIYDAPEPWGPWTTVLFANPWDFGLQTGSKTVYWNFSNKWLSPNGLDFVLVYTGPGADEWGTVEGSFRPAAVFEDGFEAGDTSAWSSTVP